MKFVIMLLCSGLYWWGGHNFLPARRFIMPFLIALGVALITTTWWAMFLPLPMVGGLCVGYGEDSWLRKIFPDHIARGIWGLIVALGESLGLLLTGFLPLYFFIVYLLTSFLLNAFLIHFPQDIGDPIIGLGFSSILFLV